LHCRLSIPLLCEDIFDTWISSDGCAIGMEYLRLALESACGFSSFDIVTDGSVRVENGKDVVTSHAYNRI